MKPGPSVFSKYSYAWITAGFFLISLAGHWLFGWFAYVNEQIAHNRPVELSEFWVQMGRDTLENWQSEFLQLLWQVGGLGPMLGQAHHFRLYAPEQIQYAIDRYTNESKRLYAVLDRRLDGHEFVAGEYSIADIAIMPWLRYPERQGVEIADYPNVRRWRDAIAARPAVQRGLQLLADRSRRSSQMDDKQREVLFGATQYQRR